MDIDDIEKNLGEFSIDNGKLFSGILSTVISNRAFLKVILAKISESDEEEEELLNLVDQQFDEITADLISQMTK